MFDNVTAEVVSARLAEEVTRLLLSKLAPFWQISIRRASALLNGPALRLSFAERKSSVAGDTLSLLHKAHLGYCPFSLTLHRLILADCSILASYRPLRQALMTALPRYI